jgi:phytol kinase
LSIQIVVALLSAAAMAALVFVVHRAGRRFALGAETQRKLVHVGVGVYAMLLPLMLDRGGFLVFAALALGVLIVLRLPRVASSGAGAAVHSVQRRSWGDFYVLFTVAALFLLSAGDPEYYIMPLAVLTVSDAAAALIGSEYGRRRFGAEGRMKSVEGTAAFLVLTWVVTMVIFVEFTEVPRHNVIWLASAISAMAAAIEADSWHGLDNIFVPLGIYCLLIGWGNAEPQKLEAVATLCIAALIAARWIARPFGMTAHALRATFIAFFITYGIATPQNTILSALAFGFHLLARRNFGGESAAHDLDFVTLLVIMGVFWLGASAVAGRNAIEFYTLTFAALAGGYAVLALPWRNMALRLAAAVPVAAAMAGLHYNLCLDLTAKERWAPRLIMFAVGTAAAALAALAGVSRPPALLRGSPDFRLAFLSFVLPASAYAWLSYAPGVLR